jgi:ABC transporter substrate binding protein
MTLVSQRLPSAVQTRKRPLNRTHSFERARGGYTKSELIRGRDSEARALANISACSRCLRARRLCRGRERGSRISVRRNQAERLPALAVELVRLPVAVIVASGGPNVAFAAKAATTTIPIVFLSGEDPVRIGLVASLARPSGNLTGINFVNRELAAKKLELLRELVPAATRCTVLVNPANVVLS